MTHCGLTVWTPEARVNRLPARDVEISVEFRGHFYFLFFQEFNFFLNYFILYDVYNYYNYKFHTVCATDENNSSNIVSYGGKVCCHEQTIRLMMSRAHRLLFP